MQTPETMRISQNCAPFHAFCFKISLSCAIFPFMQNPFSISPNPNSLYITDRIRGVLFKCRDTIDRRQGLSCLFGDLGLGKSTILRYLFAEYDAKDDVLAAFIATPIYPSAFALLKGICGAFGLEPRPSFQLQQKDFENCLALKYAEGKNIIIFIDEAQILDSKQLELIRAILNFETNTVKLVQIVLGAQVELIAKLGHKKNRALKSRIATYSELAPLSVEETAAMIQARCKLELIQNPFTPEHVSLMVERTGGVPRAVIKLCGLLYSMKEGLGVKEIPLEWVDNTFVEVGL
jgi:general secretion pathway protein A